MIFEVGTGLIVAAAVIAGFYLAMRRDIEAALDAAAHIRRAHLAAEAQLQATRQELAVARARSAESQRQLDARTAEVRAGEKRIAAAHDARTEAERALRVARQALNRSEDRARVLEARIEDIALAACVPPRHPDAAEKVVAEIDRLKGRAA